MPSTPRKPCKGNCGKLAERGRARCAGCANAKERERGTSTERGYGARWRVFRNDYRSELLNKFGIVSECGAARPDGPPDDGIHCKAQGRHTYENTDGSELHLDHDPRLQEWEKAYTDRVCDPKRIRLRCRECHSRKTALEESNPAVPLPVDPIGPGGASKCLGRAPSETAQVSFAQNREIQKDSETRLNSQDQSKEREYAARR